MKADLRLSRCVQCFLSGNEGLPASVGSISMERLIASPIIRGYGKPGFMAGRRPRPWDKWTKKPSGFRTRNCRTPVSLALARHHASFNSVRSAVPLLLPCFAFGRTRPRHARAGAVCIVGQLAGRVASLLAEQLARRGNQLSRTRHQFGALFALSDDPGQGAFGKLQPRRALPQAEIGGLHARGPTPGRYTGGAPFSLFPVVRAAARGNGQGGGAAGSIDAGQSRWEPTERFPVREGEQVTPRS